MRLLLVEDDRALADLLRRRLVRELHVVDVSHDGWVGLELAESGVFDVVILDVMLPGLSGLDVTRRLRAAGTRTPILMLTARDAIPDRVQGFDAGADDYLVKPFAFEELLVRLRALGRRGTQVPEPDVLTVGDLRLDRRSHEVTRAGTPISLAPKEYALLEYLMRHPNQVLSRTLITERIWEYGFDPYANVVDALVRRLRKAVDDHFETPMIHTVRGAGYKMKG